MTGVSTISQFPTNSLSLRSPSSKPSSTTSMLSATSVRFPTKPKVGSFSFAGGVRKKFSFTLRAVIDVDFDPENEKPYSEEPTTEIEVLKKQLVVTFYGTNFGLNATSETRAEILELVSKLEVVNPNPEPTTALSLLNGKWILAYTSFVGLFPLPSSETLVKVKEISQTIDSESFTVQNCVVFSGPGSTTAITANARFEIKSPKLVQIKFDEGIIGTPQLTDAIDIPDSIEILGHEVDLTSFKGLITSVEEKISSHPPWKFTIPENKVESWLLTTYLDEELRISRGDGGKVYVLFKEDSSFLLP